MAQALGVAIADPTRLDTCKPVHSVACELVTLRPSRGQFGRRERYGTPPSRSESTNKGRQRINGALTSSLLRFSLVLVTPAGR